MFLLQWIPGVKMATLKSYLTSLEPDMSQSIYSQSLGGYLSNSLLYPLTTLSTTIGLYDASISLDTPSSGNWQEWQDIEYINIGNEMIRVSPMTDGAVEVIQRGYNGIINMHIKGDEVWASSSKELFNDVFNDSYKQYRCIAIKNDSTSLSDPSGLITAYNFGVYIKQNSRNSNSSIKISLEQPCSQYISNASTSWTTMQIVDTSLIGFYEDNYFKEAYLRVLSGGGEGQGKVISSFDSGTGTFTFYSSFSSTYDYDTNVLYEVLPAPSQRIKTGIVSPIASGPNIIPFTSTSAQVKFVSWDVSAFAISDLNPNDVIYLWFERTIDKGVENFDNNDVVLNISYSVSE